MSTPVGIDFKSLLAYNHGEAERWHAWFEQHPDALRLNVGEKMGTVLHLVGHIFQAELYFATKLTGEEISKSAFDFETLEQAFAMHEKAHGLMARYLETADEAEMKHMHDLSFKPGMRVSSRKLATQFFLHGIHHWGQIAMEVRQGGIPSDGPHDILLSHALE